MATGHMKNYSGSVATREMNIKIKMKFHLSSVEMVYQNPINTERMCGKTYHDPLLVGIETNIAILDDRMETLRKFEN